MLVILEAPAGRAARKALERPGEGSAGPQGPEGPEWHRVAREILRVLRLTRGHRGRGKRVGWIGDELGGALEDDRLGLAREMHGGRGVGHQVAHPPRLRRSAEAERTADPHAVDGPRARPRAWPDSDEPVVRRGPHPLLDVAPGAQAVRANPGGR